MSLAGCAPTAPDATGIASAVYVPENALIIAGNQPWSDTGIDIRAGEPLTISATGRLEIGKVEKIRSDEERVVGPQGTFLYRDEWHTQEFPLPAAGRGPAPCFCLIGRIGAGSPFFVGAGRSWVPEETGRLYLGINDFDASANCGEFYADISKPANVQPAAFRTEVPCDVPQGRPGCPGDVVVIYVDGLRPDIVEEMSAMQHIPHLTEHFVQGGVYMQNAFTAFPSDTITSNGTMWTGCFSDRHGLKGQTRFSRLRMCSESFLEPMGPNRSARQLNPQGLDRAILNTKASTVGVFHGPEEAARFEESKTSNTPALYNHLRAQGSDWATGVLPVMTTIPPPLWMRSMTRHLPYLQAQDAWQYIDDANTHFAVHHLLREKHPVTIIWLPETDSVSHKQCRGQFGSTRKTIARADKLVGEITAELRAQGRLESTYLVLVSDHGHLGGQFGHLAKFDLTNEFLFEPRRIGAKGEWCGGGLGLSVKQHRYANCHTGDNSRQFVFIDGDSDGCARLYFPRGGYPSGNWSGPSSPGQLLNYPLAGHLTPINLPLTLAGATKADDCGQLHNPIDLVLMKLDDCSILITTCDRGQAVIERQCGPDGRWLYRYTPVQNVAPCTDGSVAWEPAPQAATDPLGLLAATRKGFLQQFHDETEWLWVTTGTDYPDSVVALTRHMLWQDNIKEQERNYAPDLVVTARHGWIIATHSTPGTTHGYPLAESMHATWYLSGPGIRRGARVDSPCRLADLTPTILELSGTNFDETQLDGRPLRTIYNTVAAIPALAAKSHRLKSPTTIAKVAGEAETQIAPGTPLEQPLYWDDVDLHAWQSTTYSPFALYANLPKSINQPQSGWDLNNVTYNAMAVGEWSVFRLADDALSAAVPGRTQILPTVENAEGRVAHARRPAVAEGATVINLPEVSISDYSVSSQGNMQRISKAVDWVQNRSTRLDEKIARPTRHRSVLGTRFANPVIDGAQVGFWEGYRFAQRVVAEVVDERIINGFENSVDATLNMTRATPAELPAE